MFKKNIISCLSSETSASQSIKATLHTEQLVEALSAVSAAQADGDVGWIQLHFTGAGKVIVSSVSHNLSIRFEFLGDHEGQGVLKVTGKQFIEYVKQLPAGKLTLQADLTSKLTIKSGRSVARVHLIQDSTYSGVNIPNIGSTVQIKGEALARWVDSFREFVLVDDTRYYANGAYIWLDGDTQSAPCLNAVASDALRLAKSRLTEELRVINSDGSAVLVPRKTLDEVRRVATADPGRIYTLKWHSGELFFAMETDNYAMESKCIPGAYPPYEAAIPQKISSKVMLDTKNLQESLRRALIFADKNRILKFLFEGSQLDIQSFTPGQKEGEEVIDLLIAADSSFEVNYNGTLLSGILNCLSGTKATFEWESVVRPVRITGESERGVEVFYLLVPTRF
jgi:DNA polymerase-3 subunit beta